MDWFMGKSKRNKDTAADDYIKKPYLQQDFLRERLIEGDLSPLVALPYRVDYNEWIASNTISFFEHINAVSGCLIDFCKPPNCTVMLGPGNVQYLWLDDRGKKYKCTAAQYIDYVMSFTQKCILDESIFPTKYGNSFPSSFDKIIRKIHRLLLHVLGHVYQCHCREMAALGLRSHLNTLTLHFLLFSRRFNLIENKETNPLSDLFENLQCKPRLEIPLPRKPEVENVPSSSSSQQKSALKHANAFPVPFKDSEPNGFVCEGLTACTLVS